MSTMQKRSSGGWLSRFIFISVGCLLPILAFLAGALLLSAWWDLRLSQGGVPAQGTIVAVETIGCGKLTRVNYTVRFTDRAGQLHTATFDTCRFSASSHMSRGDAVSIVYLPDNPTMIAPASGATGGSFPTFVATGTCLGCFTLLLLTGWIVVLGVWIRRRRAASGDRHALDQVR